MDWSAVWYFFIIKKTIMKKTLLIIPLLLLGITFASDSFPSFPMIIYGNINLNGGTLRVYDWSNQEISIYEITTAGKYWSENAFVLPLALNSFNGNLWFKATYNGKIYIIDSINDSNRWEWCPSKDAITFVSKTCRYDLTFKEETNSWGGGWWGWNWWWWGWGGWGGWWWGWWGWWWWGWGGWNWSSWNWNDSNTSTNDHPETNSWTTDTWNDSILETWNILKTWTIIETPINNWNPKEILSNWYTRELNDAYTFAFKNGITTMQDIHHANMNWGLNRIAMAKMLSQYAINILKKTPDTTKNCNFWDVTMQMDSDYNNWVTLACQLWIMWVWIANFRPNDEVVRSEFGTSLSRMLFWLADGTDQYYSTHLAKLKKEWIISNDNPILKELRWYVMLMLMRSAK